MSIFRNLDIFHLSFSSNLFDKPSNYCYTACTYCTYFKRSFFSQKFSHDRVGYDIWVNVLLVHQNYDRGMVVRIAPED